MKKVTYISKLEVLDFYIKHPANINHPTVLNAIKADVVKANTVGTKKGSEIDNALYNTCMGLYRSFLKSKDSHLRLEGRKARQYKEALVGIINYLRSFQKEAGMPHQDADVERGLSFIFKHWSRLNQFNQNRLGLPEIYNAIHEIIPMIKNGHDRKTSNTSQLEQFEQSLKN